MKRLLSAALAITMILGISARVKAHEGHDHGAEPHDHASPAKTNTPPAPPSDSFVPESRPLENGPPTNQERVPNFGPNPERQLTPNRQDFRGEPLEFGPPSGPRRNSPPIDDRPSYTTPGFEQRPSRINPEFDSAPRNFGSPDTCPLGRSDGRCPSGRYDSSCPNHSEFAAPRPCPYGRGQTGECAWERNHRHDQAFDAYRPLPPSAYQGQNYNPCPTGGCGHSHEGNNYPEYDEYRRLPSADPIRQPAPYFRDEQNNPSVFNRFDSQPPRTFRN